jgi:hypothetical protein
VSYTSLSLFKRIACPIQEQPTSIRKYDKVNTGNVRNDLTLDLPERRYVWTMNIFINAQ